MAAESAPALAAFRGSEAHVRASGRGESRSSRREGDRAVRRGDRRRSSPPLGREWGQGSETITRKGIDSRHRPRHLEEHGRRADVAPSRWPAGRARRSSLLDRLEGDRVALVTFAGKGAVSCPLTLDHEAVRLFLDAVDVEAVSVPGTALAAAVRAGVRALGPPVEGTEAKRTRPRRDQRRRGSRRGRRIAVRRAKRAGVVVYGSAAAPIRGADPGRDVRRV
jgi:hypothetical protein